MKTLEGKPTRAAVNGEDKTPFLRIMDFWRLTTATMACMYLQDDRERANGDQLA